MTRSTSPAHRQCYDAIRVSETLAAQHVSSLAAYFREYYVFADICVNPLASPQSNTMGYAVFPDRVDLVGGLTRIATSIRAQPELYSTVSTLTFSVNSLFIALRWGGSRGDGGTDEPHIVPHARYPSLTAARHLSSPSPDLLQQQHLPLTTNSSFSHHRPAHLRSLTPSVPLRDAHVSLTGVNGSALGGVLSGHTLALVSFPSGGGASSSSSAAAVGRPVAVSVTKTATGKVVVFQHIVDQATGREGKLAIESIGGRRPMDWIINLAERPIIPLPYKVVFQRLARFFLTPHNTQCTITECVSETGVMGPWQ